SKFYPSVYTHSITWATLGKSIAKNYFSMSKPEFQKKYDSGDEKALLYKLANDIDIAVRSCQDRQSIGIPIGPDTSHVISEIIATRIDSILQSEYSNFNLSACRYYDDYYLFVNTLDEADQVLKGLQRALNEFELEVNESKIEIRKFPLGFEESWVAELFQFQFKETNQENSVKHYFSLLWRIAEKKSKRTDWVFRYALKRFEFGTEKINSKSWKTFECLLIKSAMIEPSVLDVVNRILLTYKKELDYQSRRDIKNLVYYVLTEQSKMNHHFEVSWALWMAHSFDIMIDEKIANIVINLGDTTSCLILLFLAKEREMVIGEPDFYELEFMLVDTVLSSEQWLLAYEAIKKGWLKPIDDKLIDKNLFFSILYDLNVEFYDAEKQLSVVSVDEESGYTVKDETEKSENIVKELDEDHSLASIISNLQ
ncbi:RNA-directed DNA polymerase, partial [Balneolales bacterium ANBcel1]|nr:RNA-directed DNA polymerase [Balneolales bacterium ANBcel1]